MVGHLPPLSLVTALLVFCLGAALPQASSAQTGNATDAERLRALERRLDASQKLIEKLSERIAELERAAGPRDKSEPATPSMAEQAQSIATLQESVGQISGGLSRTVTHTGVPVHGFLDAGAAASSRDDPQRLRGLRAGTLDLYLTPQFGDHVKSLMEIVFEYNADGRGEMEAERSQVGYTVNDQLTLWAGRFHTPIGLWNTLYHHGANLQPSIFRPRFVDFEDRGGLVPTHTVGVWGSGKTNLDAGKLSYDIYVGNGPTVRERSLDFNAFTDDNSGKLLGVNLGIAPRGALRGVNIGVHAFGATADSRAASDTVLARTRLRMAGGYFSYDANGWEGLAEYYHFANFDLATSTPHTSHIGYLHLGRSYGTLIPYLRYERASLDGADNFFATQRLGRSYSRALIGARYELDVNAALKVELSATKEAAATLIDANGAAGLVEPARYRRLAVEYSIAF